MEQEFQLIQASERQQQAPSLQPLKADTYTHRGRKAYINQVIATVNRHYHYTSLSEYNTALGYYQVAASRGSERSRMYNHGGLQYTLLDGNGRQVGIPVKASALHQFPGMRYLHAQYQLNRKLRTPKLTQLSNMVDQGLRSPEVRDLKGLSTYLEAHKIDVHYHQSTKGQLYGVTFIDHERGIVAKGSALGRNYSVNGLRRQLEGERPSSQQTVNNSPKPTRPKRYPRQHAFRPRRAYADIFTVLKHHRGAYQLPVENQLSLRKKKRKKRRRL
ncbi:hypothetical protein LVD15_11780 [Fulvivirga maritima]|uniref:hypothetical protein n=1 Tax=Fulvivirga maritima TaxID=2904247 RepID=UPI001F30F7E3|nr:hypothetical protein [Fulvivirga maritima]UII29075.1 hypothetical protein LVD15_11780 [Fulvivirga maritima]